MERAAEPARAHSPAADPVSQLAALLRFILPRAAADDVLRCRVRTTDKGFMSMHIEDGSALLLCAKQKGKDWLIYADSKCSRSCVLPARRNAWTQFSAVASATRC